MYIALEMRYTAPVSCAVGGLSFHRARKQALRRKLTNQTYRKKYKYEKDLYCSVINKSYTIF